MRQPRNGKGAEPKNGSALAKAHVDRRSSLQSSHSADSSQAAQHIYDGRSYLGGLDFRPDGAIVATAADGACVGKFEKRQLAMLALFEHCRSAAT